MTSTAAQAEAIWSEHPWDIALVTAHVDVIDVPARFGSPLHQLLKTSCPTAMAPVDRRWLFFLVPGSLDRSLLSSAGGLLHSGTGGWVPAPGTVTDSTGRIRWLVHPHLTAWRPYQRRDPIDTVFSTVDWSAPDAPQPELPRIVDAALG